ncbi:glucans biosynthesis glucosyltransferase MdoH [Noviherbaspirillum pedocola]|uniref:Glucans biosynthesis glucosyltransferase H n=1 Tax=Noviherbaspirillum pedocola TaxID=2801341 RepID=A0A934W5E7_9BURK|nr:glucans biosynthesis glucosyltransferase MdoH [Noviherbaspirillum pedocola]MBK4733138.1 glucans biosynthesis glucosyltransferase MdoH [Noviherbaspirillum pedocola]
MRRADAAALRVARYLDRLGLSPQARAAIEAKLAIGAQTTPAQAMADLHRLLAELQPDAPGADAVDPAAASIAARIGLSHAAPSVEEDAHGQARLCAARPLHRASMTPHPWGPLNPLVRWSESVLRRQREWKARGATRQREPWPADAPQAGGNHPNASPRRQPDGGLRRGILLLLMLGQTALATWFMAQVLPYQGTQPIEWVTMAFFAVLFCWVSAGFWTAMAGFWVLLRGTDRYLISRNAHEGAAIPENARTAIVMPICNEDVTAVFAGLRATYESVARSGVLDRFDFFVLSDSYQSDTCAAEVAAWSRLCQAVEGFGRIFYRRRHRRVKRKSGNIDDFCRRWAKDYRYMIVLDADSVMSGDCLATLVRLMEANPNAGIIQTAPRAAGRDTLYARIQQFSTRVYGPLFTAGLHFWQLGESHYWGHNAIIRLDPFVRHCALAPLPGEGSLSGEILSHDFVEAALMRRAGWGVWIAYDLDGSFEEMPPNLLDELKRDRRWCHGNLMNFKLFAARGMHPVHRAVFATGVMAYLSAPLWFLFLVLSTGLLAYNTLKEPTYFVEPRQLFPIWPQWHPEQALALFGATATLLFLPKILSVLLIWIRGAKGYGGRMQVAASMLIELLFSMLLAPVRMLFHTRFVSAAYFGLEMTWKSPPREDSETAWSEAVRKHGSHTVLGFAWGGTVYWLNPSYLPWLMPIAGALVLSIPISVLSSRVSLGRAFRRAQLFLIPEEAEPPRELREQRSHIAEAPSQPGFAEAAVDPVVNALLCASGRARKRSASLQAAREALLQQVWRADPESLTEAQKWPLLNDPLLLSRLHLALWSEEEVHPNWRAMMDRPGQEGHWPGAAAATDPLSDPVASVAD